MYQCLFTHKIGLDSEPPITNTFLFLASLGFLGLEFIVSLSVLVMNTLFSNFGSMYGAISLLSPQEAFCQVPFLIY